MYEINIIVSQTCYISLYLLLRLCVDIIDSTIVLLPMYYLVLF